MRILSERMFAKCDSSVVEVESELSFDNPTNGVIIHRLIIDSKLVEEKTKHIGKCFLEGVIEQGVPTPKKVIAIINQGLFRTKYRLEVDGREYSLIEKN